MNGLRKLLVPLAIAVPTLLLSRSAGASDDLSPTVAGPDVTAKSAIVMDAATGKILWAKDADTPRYPASCTKIMTGLLLLEHTKPTDMIVAPADVTTVKESSMHLKPFERVTAHDMLFALMLRSANDGAYAVAVNVGGSQAKFVAMMNERARELGCTHTHFDNPHGLNDTLHYTTAHDLALIAREAMRRPDFREAVRTYRYQIQRSIDQHDLTMVNHDKWLAKDATADGIKTGYTVPAGHCFVGSATRDGYRVITVEMFSQHWELDQQAMLHWAFANHVRLPLVSHNDQLGNVAVQGGVAPTVPVCPASDVDSLVTRATAAKAAGNRSSEVQLTGPLRAPVHVGDPAGTATVRDPEGFEQQVPVVAAADDQLTAVASITRSKPNGGLALIGGALLIGTVYVRGRARRTRSVRRRAPRKS